MGLKRIVSVSTMIFGMVLALGSQSGCSFAFVNGPPEHHAEMATFECTESNAWPVLDAIWAGLNGLGAASAAGDNQNPNQGQIIAVGLGWLALSGISAITGFSKVSACNDAKRKRDERYFGRGGPGPLTPAAAPAEPAAPPATSRAPTATPAAAPSAPAGAPATDPSAPAPAPVPAPQIRQ